MGVLGGLRLHNTPNFLPLSGGSQRTWIFIHILGYNEIGKISIKRGMGGMRAVA